MALLTLLSQLGHPASDLNFGPPSIDVLKRAAELLREIKEVLIEPSLSWNPIQLLGAIGKGECDYAVFTFAYVTFQNRGIQFAPVPSWDGESFRGVVIGGTGLAVSANSRRSKEALAFARFAASEYVQTEIWPRFGGQPAHRRAWETLRGTDEFYRSVKPAIESSYVRPRFSGWIQFQRQAGELVCSWLGERNRRADTVTHQIQALWARSNQPRKK
jgi:multiple sugar transport system substrate-binding protein